jgi:hypothetical protein
MDENLALEEKAAAGDPVSVEALRSMRSESQRELEAVIAQAQFTFDGDDSSSDMEEDWHPNMVDPPLVRDPEADNEFEVEDVLPLPTWQTFLPMEGDTAAGTSSDAKSTARGYKRSHQVWIAFQASLTTTTMSRLNLSSKDLYLPGRTDDYVNRGLARLFVRFYVETRGRTKTNFGNAIHYLQRVLDDSLNRANKVAKRGSIKDDRFLTKFKKGMLVQVAEEYRSEVHDLHASLSTQIPRSQELALVEACYGPTVLPNLSALAKSNVVTGYAHSGQVGHRGQEGRALMMHHGFISQMEYLGDGETVDNFIHAYGKTNRVGRLETKSFCNHRNPRMDTSAHLGMNVLLRFCVLCEPFPDFLDGEDYTKRPVFRSVRSYHEEYPPSSQNSNWNAVFKVCGIHCDKVTHQQRQQLQQKLADAGLDLMHLERFIGYASNGQKQMNGNQLHSYLFNSPVQAVAGAADGDPNSPSTFVSGWDVTVSTTELSTLCPWLWHAISQVENAMAQFTDPKEQASHCLIQAHGSLSAIVFRVTSAVKLLASLPVDDKNNLLVDEPAIYLRWSHHPVLSLPFFRSQTFFDICSRVQHSQKQSALLLANDPTSEQKSWFGREVQKNIVPKLTHNIRLLQSIITSNREFRSVIHQDKTNTISLLHNLDHNIHTLDGNHDMIITRLDTLAAQNAAIMSHFSITADHSLSPSTLTSPSPLQMKSQLPPFPVTPFPSSPSIEPKGWPNSSYDPVTNTKGEPRKRAPPLKLNHRPFSDSNITARDFWIEYKYGTNGHPSLESLERDFGTKWRSDVNFKRSDGKSGTSLKATWSYRLPIYAYIEFLIQMKGFAEDDALLCIEEIFQSNRSNKANKPNLASCKKDFVRRWGKVDLKKGVLVFLPSPPSPSTSPLSPSI